MYFWCGVRTHRTQVDGAFPAEKQTLGKLLKPLPSVSFWKKLEYMQPRNVSSQPSMPSITMNTVCCVITTF